MVLSVVQDWIYCHSSRREGLPTMPHGDGFVEEKQGLSPASLVLSVAYGTKQNIGQKDSCECQSEKARWGATEDHQLQPSRKTCQLWPGI